MSDKLLPQAIVAEESTLGSILIDPGALDEVSFLCPDDFYRDGHRTIFAAMQALHTRQIPCDLITLCGELERSGHYEEIGGQAYLATLINSVPTSANVVYYAKQVQDTALQRQAIHIAGNLAAGGYEGEPRQAMATAMERLKALQQTSQQDTPAKFQFIPASDVEELPPMEWLIGGMIPLEATSAVWGIEGCGKSFVLLDMACCIATGQYWRGHAIKRIGVIAYIAGEGMRGMSLRIRAWRETHHLPQKALDNLYMIGKAPQLLQPDDMQALLDALRALPQQPDLVIIDTLARSTAGADENGQQEMGLLIRAMDTIKQEFGAQVLTAHHANASGERMRGSTVLPGAFETVIKISQEVEGLVKISCQKQKDGAAKFAPIHLRLQQVTFSDMPDLSTCVLVDVTPAEVIDTARNDYRQVLSMLYRQGANAKSKDWEREVRTYLGWGHEQFDGIRRALKAEGYVSKGTKLHDPYQLTSKGLALVKQSEQSETSRNSLDGSGAGSENSRNSRIVLQSDYSDYSSAPDDERCRTCGAEVFCYDGSGVPYCKKHQPKE